MMNTIKLSFLFSAIVIFLASCGSGDTGEDVTVNDTTVEAEVPETPEVTEPEVPAGDVYALAVTESVVNWRASKKLVGSHNGTIQFSEGSLIVDKGTLVGGTLTVDMTTIVSDDLTEETGKSKLEGHLLSADFFDTEAYPTATFTLTSAEVLDEPGENGETHRLTGDMTIKGKSNTVSFLAQVTIADGVLVGGGQFSIDRTQWDIIYGSESNFVDLAKDKVINDNIELGITLSAAK